MFREIYLLTGLSSKFGADQPFSSRDKARNANTLRNFTFRVIAMFSRCYGISHFRILSVSRTRFATIFIDLAALPLGNGDSGKLERAERDKGS